MIKTYVILFFISYFHAALASQRVRHVEVNGDEIVTVKTSLGIASIIQVPDRPNSVVVGDQDSYKVEYLDQAITIKPITPGARSNLYIYTDWKRFNVELISGPQDAADYVVYLKPKVAKKTNVSPIRWRKFNNSLQNDGLLLRIKRLGLVGNELGLVEFEITSSKKDRIKPEWIWLSQNDEVCPIHNLVLSGLDVDPKNLITGLLQVRLADFEKGPIRLEVKRKKSSYLTLPKAEQWSQ